MQRRSHNPAGVTTTPVANLQRAIQLVRGQDVLAGAGRYPTMTQGVDYIICVDCGMFLPMAETVPGLPTICPDCYCVRQTGDICEYPDMG
jgi:hypothetical protein